MKKSLLGGTVGLVVVGFLAGGQGTATASLDLQKKAKEAGITVQNNCLYCHGEKLPKKGAVTENARGQWLIAEKEKRKAKTIDPAWLKDYVEPNK